MFHGIWIKVLLTAFAFSNQFMMASLQQGCPGSPSPDSGNFTTLSIQCGAVLKITRPKGGCPHPLDVTIEIPSVENYTANQPLNPLVTIGYEGREVHLDSEIPTDSKFNGIFTLNINNMTSNDNGLNATLSVKHGNGNSFDVRFEILPPNPFNGANKFGPFRIDDSSLNFQSVSFINTTNETIVTMITTNLTNCTDRPFSLPLTLELLNGSQYDLQNRNHTCNLTMPRNNALMALNFSRVNHTCLDSGTTVETKLTLQNLPQTYMCSGVIIRAKLSESTARQDVCISIMGNEEYCQPASTTTPTTTGTIAGIISAIVVVAVFITIIIVAVAIVCKRRQNRSTVPRQDGQNLQIRQSQTAENTNSDQVTGTEHSEAARHEGIRSTTADHQRSGTSN